MKIWISYFYQVRKFEPNMIPFSTAMWDPKWFHKFEGQEKIFIDDRGVINGLRVKQLVFPRDAFNYLKEKGSACEEGCSLQNQVEFKLKQNKLKNDWNDFGCEFMNKYFDHLWNNVDYDKLIEFFENTVEKFKETMHFDDADIVLLVHEAPSTPCGERPVLKRWFAEYGYDLEEWNPYE